LTITEEKLRRYAVARSLFRPTTLGRAINKLGFVQADPIQAPARAQDLMLRHLPLTATLVNIGMVLVFGLGFYFLALARFRFE